MKRFSSCWWWLCQGSAADSCEVPGPYYSQNSSGSEDPDAWEDWWLDFFEPAGELLTAAPWVFARGNHELCSRSGPGWFYFLDASSELPEGGGEQLSCPPQEGAGPAPPHLRFVAPYTVRLAGLDVSVDVRHGGLGRCASLHPGSVVTSGSFPLFSGFFGPFQVDLGR